MNGCAHCSLELLLCALIVRRRSRAAKNSKMFSHPHAPHSFDKLNCLRQVLIGAVFDGQLEAHVLFSSTLSLILVLCYIPVLHSFYSTSQRHAAQPSGRGQGVIE